MQQLCNATYRFGCSLSYRVRWKRFTKSAMRENETLSEQNNGELKGEYPDSQVIEKRMKIKSGILRCAQKQNSAAKETSRRFRINRQKEISA